MSKTLPLLQPWQDPEGVEPRWSICTFESPCFESPWICLKLPPVSHDTKWSTVYFSNPCGRILTLSSVWHKSSNVKVSARHKSICMSEKPWTPLNLNSMAPPQGDYQIQQCRNTSKEVWLPKDPRRLALFQCFKLAYARTFFHGISEWSLRQRPDKHTDLPSWKSHLTEMIAFI